MTTVIERARAEITDGRLWKARDRLLGALVQRADDELLELLGEVHYAMGDLPAAGAVVSRAGATAWTPTAPELPGASATEGAHCSST